MVPCEDSSLANQHCKVGGQYSRQRSFELPGCQDMWIVFSGQGKQEHAFLILSRTESSMILQTGQEINELDSSGFFTSGPTVFSGNLGSNLFIVQVTPYSVLLLCDSELVQTVPLDLGSPLTSACCTDSHLAVLLSSHGTMASCLYSRPG